MLLLQSLSTNQTVHSSAIFYSHGMNIPDRSQRLPGWIKNIKAIYCLQKSGFKYNTIRWLKVERWKKIQHENVNKRKTKLGILISDK